MRGRNLISTFGFKQVKADSERQVAPTYTNSQEEWLYDMNVKDWINTDTGQLMTQYMPDWRLEKILEYRMDKTMN